MTRKTRLLLIGAVLLVVIAGVTIAMSIERFVPPRRAEVRPVQPTPPPATTAHITATLFYGSLDGQALVPLRREVPLAEGVLAQGAQILRAQLGAAPPPLISVIPKGTALRAFYVTTRGEAVVDLSREVTANHPGGSLMESLTVYAIVNAVTANLPGLQRVQLLVNGREVETIAGHLDVRAPLGPDMSLVRER
jgi:spore germination protein GerM